MPDAIGADATRVLALLEKSNFHVFDLIEDPATVWHLGAQRYSAIAESCRGLTSHRDKLAIDLNIVGRYQNVYPTKQQTGTELFNWCIRPRRIFSRSLSASRNRFWRPIGRCTGDWGRGDPYRDPVDRKTVVESARGVGVHWKVPALVDGQIWPAADDETLWLPGGAHSIEPAPSRRGPRLLYSNGELRSARIVDGKAIEFSCRSSARAIALVDLRPQKIQIDGTEAIVSMAGQATVLLPRGQHLVNIITE